MSDNIDYQTADRNEELAEELERRNSSRQTDLIDNIGEYTGSKFKQPTKEEDDDLVPITQKEQAEAQTTGFDAYSSLKQWSKLPEGEERQAAKEAWTQRVYGMSAEEYDSSNFMQQFYG